MYYSLPFLTHTMSGLLSGCKYPVVLTSCFISISINLVSCLHDVSFFHNKCYRVIFQHSIFGWRCILNSSPKPFTHVISSLKWLNIPNIARPDRPAAPTAIPIDFRWFKFKTITQKSLLFPGIFWKYIMLDMNIPINKPQVQTVFLA